MPINFLKIFAPLVLLASLASAQCSEASRFGNLQVSPTTLAPGDSFTVVGNFTCSAVLGFTPTFLDYFIQVPVGNNGHEAPILVARRTYNQSADPPIDTFTTVLPSWFYFAGAQYQLFMDNSFAKPGPNGDSVITVGSISQPINITGF
ncbi:hypothetical protein C8R44DRAFT_611748 [Mycena epipterygia]|nr:hypothetical protein C8R44DRAFT_611748 [Mycena epipterygia]